VNLQRTDYKKGKVTPDRVKLLNDIPSWSWNAHEASWLENFQKTVRRHEEKGNCMVPQHEDSVLFSWQAQQRMFYRQGKLTPDRIKLLSVIPTWIWDPVEAVWQKHFEKTLRRQEETGDCNATKLEDAVLSAWQSIQRRLYNQGKLAPPRVKLLNEIPTWLWDRKKLKGFATTRQHPAALQKAVAISTD
jgi:hypothetical protein